MTERSEMFRRSGTDTGKMDIYECIENMANEPQNAKERLKDIQELAEIFDQTKRFKEWQEDMKKVNKGETVLHRAITLLPMKTEEEKEVVKYLIKTFPQLIREDRKNTKYNGQTSLHLAVCKGNGWLTDEILDALSRDKRRKQNLLKTKATGSIFHNTVMMGELPLTIAALTFNKEIFDKLLVHGAGLDEVNSNGENVCHSLVRYAYLYPDKVDDVLKMCRYISQDKSEQSEQQSESEDTTRREQRESRRNKTDENLNNKIRKKIWLMINHKEQNPLQLSAELGLHKIFCFIMEKEGYCHKNSKDGLFDIKVYDVTEIDAISGMKTATIKGVDEETDSTYRLEKETKRTMEEPGQVFKKSVLMMLLDLDPSVAFQFVLYAPLRRVVDLKWTTYRKFVFPCWFLYFVFISFLSWYSLVRSEQLPNFHQANLSVYNTSRAPVFAKRISQDPFVTAFGAIALVFGLLFVVQEVVRLALGRMSFNLLNPYSNGVFRLMFVAFGFCLILDFFLAFISEYENYLLIVSVIIGWFLNLFFLRVIRFFSFFTVLIQKVCFVDISRFFVVLCLEIVAFSIALYMVLQGSEAAANPDFSNLGRVLFSMFNLMIGNGDLASVYDTRHPVLCIMLFIAFIVMTTLLMMNALIAMMSRTCVELVEDVGDIRAHYRHFKLQQLSMILFIESLIPKSRICKAGKCRKVMRYSSYVNRRVEMWRFMLEVRSLVSDDEQESPHAGLGYLRRFLQGMSVLPKEEDQIGSKQTDASDRTSSKQNDVSDHIDSKRNDAYDHSLAQTKSKRNDGFGHPLAQTGSKRNVASDYTLTSTFPSPYLATASPRKSTGELDIYNLTKCYKCHDQESECVH